MRQRRLVVAQPRHGVLQQLAVQVETDRRDMSALLRAQDVSCAADLQIPQRQFETGPEMRVAPYRLQPFPRVRGQRTHRRHKQIRERLTVVPPDTAAQLIQFGQAETVRPVDDDRVRVRNVHAAFDDGRADQYIVFAFHELRHDILQLAGGHLPMGDHRARGRHEFLDHLLYIIYCLHAVVKEEDLPAALHFAQNGLPYQLHVELRNNRRHRQAVRRRRHDRAQIADAGNAEIQRSRDRRRRHRQNVQIGPQLLQTLFVRHAETLLLIDDQQS